MSYLLLLKKLMVDSYLLLYRHSGLLFAKSLAFQTAFCFVPAIVTLLLIANQINLLDQPIGQLQNIFTEQFIPNIKQKEEIIEQLQVAANYAKGATMFAVGIFIFSTFSLVTSIQEIFYRFSEQPAQPNFLKQILIYVFFVLGLIVSLISISLLTYVLSISHYDEITIPSAILKILNLFLLSGMIFSLYQFISPTKFKKSFTFFISIIIGVILYLAQKLFALYILWFPGYSLVYGAIAFLPFLFFWLYIYWIVFLAGYSLLLVLNNIHKTH